MNIGLLTSGGDAPGMNAAIRAVVRAAEYFGFQVTGICNGYSGIFNREFRPMTSRSVANILQTGGTVLGTGRCPRFLEPAGRSRAAEIIKAEGIDALVVIGGDGSYQGAAALNVETGIRVIGLPGSIDNDVGGTDFSIGFDTAVNTALDAIDRVRDTAAALPRLFFVEVMGRDSGQIAAAVSIASGAEAMVVPEQQTDINQLANIIDAGFDIGKSAGIIVVAEGDETGGAAALAEQVQATMTHDIDYRIVVLGYTQRGGSPTAADRLLASRLGVRAIQALQNEEDPCVLGVRCGEIVSTTMDDALGTGPVIDPEIMNLARILAGIKH